VQIESIRAVTTAKIQAGLTELPRAVEATASAPPVPAGMPRASAVASRQPRVKKSFYERLEAYISRLSTKNNFWHKVCSLIWLPFAFRSGITMKRVDENRFTAVLPFKRINRNWYNAMAGAALLGNCEVAAGMYLFNACGGEYIVVCKEMHYRFLRPCLGPAVYHVINCEDIPAKVAGGQEFNIDLEIEVRQQLRKKGREARVGRCDVTFHCTPKKHARERKRREAEAEQAKVGDVNGA